MRISVSCIISRVLTSYLLTTNSAHHASESGLKEKSPYRQYVASVLGVHSRKAW